jgi:hypothetical protein
VDRTLAFTSVFIAGWFIDSCGLLPLYQLPASSPNVTSSFHGDIKLQVCSIARAVKWHVLVVDAWAREISGGGTDPGTGYSPSLIVSIAPILIYHPTPSGSTLSHGVGRHLSPGPGALPAVRNRMKLR